MSLAVEFEAIRIPSCGLDVHKDKIEACIIDASGQKHQKMFDTMRLSLYSLRDWIISLKCYHVLMESTSVYWIPIYEILEEVTGMTVGVGNARHMKQVPGRAKTDKEDSGWIAKLCMIGFILKSFVVSRKFRELREYTRYHKKLVQERARQINRIEKLLQMNGFKLSSVLSNIVGVSGLKLLHKLRDKGRVTLSEVTAALDRRVKTPPEEIERAINGEMKFTSRHLLGRMLKRLEMCDKEILEMYDAMVSMCEKHRPQVAQLDSIPGVGELSAMYIIAEISTDMSSFKSANHLTAWAGLAPKDKESAGKLKASKTQKANIYIKTVLTECAWAVIRTRNTRLSNWYWSNVKRIGEKKAITAVARKLLVYIYAMLKSGEMYDDRLDAADTESRKAEKLDSARKIVAHQSNTANGHSAANRTNDTNVEAVSQSTSGAKGQPTTVAEANVLKQPKKRGRPRKADNTGKHSDIG